MCFFHYQGLWCMVYCWGWFCQFALVDCTIWLPCLLSIDVATCSYKCSLFNFTPISLHMLKCSWAHTLSCLFMYCSFASTGHAHIMCSIVSPTSWHHRHLKSVSVCNIFVARYFVCNAWSCPATISVSVSSFRSPLYSLSNVSVISCLSMLLMYWPCITLSIFNLKTLPILAFLCCILCMCWVRCGTEVVDNGQQPHPTLTHSGWKTDSTRSARWGQWHIMK